MEIRPLSAAYAVSPQIAVTDIPAIKSAGYKSVLCNRPDDENLPQDQIDAMAAAVEQAGLSFADNPFNHMQFGPDIIAKQKVLMEKLPGPVLAYCASGTRCSIVWAFMQAGHQSTDDILSACRDQGYSLDHLRPALDQYAQQG